MVVLNQSTGSLRRTSSRCGPTSSASWSATGCPGPRCSPRRPAPAPGSTSCASAWRTPSPPGRWPAPGSLPTCGPRPARSVGPRRAGRARRGRRPDAHRRAPRRPRPRCRACPPSSKPSCATTGDGGRGRHRLAVHPVGAIGCGRDPLRRLRLDGRDVRVSEPTCVRCSAGPRCRRRPRCARAAVDAGHPPGGRPGRCRSSDRRGRRRCACGDARGSTTSTTRWTRPWWHGPRCTPARRSWWRVACRSSSAARGLAVVAGLVWLAALRSSRAGCSSTACSPRCRRSGSCPCPSSCFAGGLLLGPLLAAVSSWLARIGARRRGAVRTPGSGPRSETVADGEILAPVRRVLDRHAATREALRHAADV